MSDETTKPCKYCGKKLPVEAVFCVACGKGQKDDAGEESRSFALADDDAPAATPPPPPTPAPPSATGEDSIETIELEDDPAEARPKEEEAPPPDGEAPEVGDRTVRMPLSDVVQAWAEDGPEVPTTPDAEAPKVPLTSNPKFVIAVLVLAAIAVGIMLMVL